MHHVVVKYAAEFLAAFRRFNLAVVPNYRWQAAAGMACVIVMPETFLSSLFFALSDPSGAPSRHPVPASRRHR
jgi:hypothetical protein